MVDINEGTTDGCFVVGNFVGPVGVSEGTTGRRLAVGIIVGPGEVTAVGKHLLKKLSSLGTCTKMLGVVPRGTPWILNLTASQKSALFTIFGEE
jgi:hypothetical protein